ncbi:MAG: hypothetical protein JWL86_7029 [Rhizobium sp.]|nr:hypothetical protein [Rhizobium sp.]
MVGDEASGISTNIRKVISEEGKRLRPPTAANKGKSPARGPNSGTSVSGPSGTRNVGKSPARGPISGPSVSGPSARGPTSGPSVSGPSGVSLLNLDLFNPGPGPISSGGSSSRSLFGPGGIHDPMILPPAPPTPAPASRAPPSNPELGPPPGYSEIPESSRPSNRGSATRRRGRAAPASGRSGPAANTRSRGQGLVDPIEDYDPVNDDRMNDDPDATVNYPELDLPTNNDEDFDQDDGEGLGEDNEQHLLDEDPIETEFVQSHQRYPPSPEQTPQPETSPKVTGGRRR